MIRGTVNLRSAAVVGLRVRAPGGAERALDTTVDTGFSSSLMLPTGVASALGLVRHSKGRAILADGSARRFDICAAEVEWDGTWLPVMVTVLGDEPLLGMRLLTGYKVVIEVEPGGYVAIEPLGQFGLLWSSDKRDDAHLKPAKQVMLVGVREEK